MNDTEETWCPCGKYHVQDDRHEGEAPPSPDRLTATGEAVAPAIPAAPFVEAISHVTDGPPNITARCGVCGATMFADTEPQMDAAIRQHVHVAVRTKEEALREVLLILDRLDKDDQQRVVDALVALGAE